MKVLVIGSGGREHAIAWQCSQFNEVKHVFVAPGNAGTALEKKISNISIDSENIPGLISFVKEELIDITIVGPEAPLVLGIVDEFKHEDLAIFGPSKKASQLEGSKVFCKDFLDRNDIPTAYYQAFTETKPAIDYVKEKGAPIVIKADGLAAGKGVIIAHSLEEATDANLLVHVVDISNNNKSEQINEVEKILKEIKANELPQILVLNQIDKIPLKAMFDRDECGNITRIQLSAKTGDGIEFLKLAIVEHSQKQINQRNGQYA